VLGETISAMQWGSAAVAVLGAAASIAGLLRFFAVQARGGRGATAGGSDEGWSPVLGERQE